MGTLLAKKKGQSLPKDKSKQQCFQLVKKTKHLLDFHKRNIGIHVTIKEFGEYASKHWQMSKVKGSVAKTKQNIDGPTKQIKLDLQQIYRIQKLLFHFGTGEIIQGRTPTSIIDQDRQCCICLDKRASTMLPCSHCYCDICICTYIIQKDQHQCPLCRQTFECSRASLKRDCFQIFDGDKELYQQIRVIILDYIEKYNPEVKQWLLQQFQ